MKLFELFATLSLDTKQFQGDVKKAVALGDTLSSSISSKVTAGTVALGNAMYDVTKRGMTMLANLGKSAVQSAAEVRAEKAQFESTFGDMGAAATNIFKGIGNETNILSTRLRGVGTKAFAQFTGAGMEGADAMAAMERYTKLAADAAAYYDISLEDADTRLRSFLRGNTEAGDAIGLFTSESQRNSYAVEMYGKKWQDLTEEQRNMLLLNVAEDIYRQSGAMGQAAREGSNWANVTANLQEAWRQTLGVIGAPIIDALTPFVENITTKLQSEEVQTAISTFSAKVGEIAGATFDGFTALLNAILGDDSGIEEGSVLDNILSFVRDISAWVNENQALVLGFFGSLAISMLAANAPVALLIAGVALLAANWNTIKDAVTAAWNAIVDFFGETVPEAFTQMLENIKNWWNEKVVTPINNAIDALKSFLGINADKTVTITYMEQFGTNGDDGGAGGRGSTYLGGVGGWGRNTVTDVSAGSGSIYAESHAVGLDYVPYNNYLSRLHEGEAVLTKAEATAWRRGESGGSGDLSWLPGAISASVRDAVRGMAVNMNGERVGNIVTDTVSQNLAQRAWEERYST